MSKPWTGWTLVFDLDGTLVETAPDLHAALNHTLALKNLAPVPIGAIRQMIGDGAKALIRKGLSFNDRAIDEIEIEETLWPAFIEHYLANISRFSEPFEGVEQALESLLQDGATLAVCTNKAQHLAEEVLTGLNMSQYFVATLGGDKASTPKPDGAHVSETIALAGGTDQRAIMIGDSHTDEWAAHACGLPFVFVTFGYGRLSGIPYPNLKSINHWRQMSDALTELKAPN